MLGNVTRRKVWMPEAPRVRAASSSAIPTSLSTGMTSRITKGMQMKIVTITIEGNAKMIWTPRAAKNGSNHPPRPNRSTAMTPTITGDTAIGRSTKALRMLLPKNRSRASTRAAIKPSTPVTTTVIIVTTKVSQ